MSLFEVLKAYPREAPLILRERAPVMAGDIIAEIVRAPVDVVEPGDVVAIVGDFRPDCIAQLIALIEKRAIVVPLSPDTRAQHHYFFEQGGVDWVIAENRIERVRPKRSDDPLLRTLRDRGHPGLVLYSSGTSGRPKAILHDLVPFLAKYGASNKTMRTLTFLLFDHIGGVNTLFYALHAGSQLILPTERSPESIFRAVERERVELLPTSPTFLRLSANSLDLEGFNLSSLKIVTYGTEVMEEKLLHHWNRMLPNADFRQTYGMSELGILAVKSRARDSLFFKIGGGVECRVAEGILKLKSPGRMIGYMNAPSPFDDEGFYDTKDIVDVEADGDGPWFRIRGRDSEIVNIGGVKIAPGEVESVVAGIAGVREALAFGRPNPITGQHLELLVAGDGVTQQQVRAEIRARLPAHCQPARIKFVDRIPHNHRFKRLGAGAIMNEEA
ncbi:MAG: fatty acid--CoA ligase family protein [Hyphomonadaceae bacterium]